MNASELIKLLENITRAYGDIEVWYFPYDWASPSPMDKLDIREDIIKEPVIMIGAE